MVTRTLTTLWFAFVISLISGNAQNRIYGTVTDSSGCPLAGVDCVLASLSDTAAIAHTLTDSKGTFSLNVDEDGQFLLKFSCLGYRPQQLTCKRGDVGVVKLTESIQNLSEVTVSAQGLRSFGNADIILLDRRARQMGNNALEAISSLPQFRLSTNSGELLTADGKIVLVLIDGIKRSVRELMLLKADEIKTLHYYSNPPARFAHENIGAVLDVATKRTNKRQYSLYLDTKNSITTGYGTNLISTSYSDSLNKVSAAYFLDYRHLNRNTMENRYVYPDDVTNDYKGLSGKYTGAYHIGQLFYQRFQNSNLFNITLEYRKFPATQQYSQQLLRTGTLEDANHRRLQSDFSSISANIYFGHTFRKGNSLSVNVVNTYFKSNSNNNLTNTSGTGTFTNVVDNKSYSLIAEALYTDKLWQGNIQIGAYYQYKNLRQTDGASNLSTVNTQKEYLYADYTNQWGALSYNLGIGVENNRYRTATKAIANYILMRPSVSLNYQLHKHSSLRLISSIASEVPNVGQLTDSRTIVDERFYLQGNSNLKPYHFYRTELSFQYASANNIWFVKPSISHAYYPSKNMTVIFADGSDFVNRIVGIRHVNEYGASLVLSCRPFSWLTLQPYYNYLFSKYNTPNQCVNHNLNNVGISCQVVTGKWQFITNHNLPMTTVDGDVFEKHGYNANVSLTYRIGAVTVGAMFIYNPDPSKIYADTPSFHFVEKTRWGNFKNLVALTFVYSLSKGNSRRHLGKNINNRDNDSGLTKYNTAK